MNCECLYVKIQIIVGCVEPLLDMLNLNSCKINPLLPVGRYTNIDPSLSGLLTSWTPATTF